MTDCSRVDCNYERCGEWCVSFGAPGHRELPGLHCYAEKMCPLRTRNVPEPCEYYICGECEYSKPSAAEARQCTLPGGGPPTYGELANLEQITQNQEKTIRHLHERVKCLRGQLNDPEYIYAGDRINRMSITLRNDKIDELRTKVNCYEAMGRSAAETNSSERRAKCELGYSYPCGWAYCNLIDSKCERPACIPVKSENSVTVKYEVHGAGNYGSHMHILGDGDRSFATIYKTSDSSSLIGEYVVRAIRKKVWGDAR